MIVYKNENVEFIVTDAQKKALDNLKDRWRGVHVYAGTNDLPPGYINIVLDPDGHPVYGGISPEGDVST